MSCWRYLRDWKQAGAWEQIHQMLLSRLREAGPSPNQWTDGYAVGYTGEGEAHMGETR